MAKAKKSELKKVVARLYPKASDNVEEYLKKHKDHHSKAELIRHAVNSFLKKEATKWDIVLHGLNRQNYQLRKVEKYVAMIAEVNIHHLSYFFYQWPEIPPGERNAREATQKKMAGEFHASFKKILEEGGYLRPYTPTEMTQLDDFEERFQKIGDRVKAASMRAGPEHGDRAGQRKKTPVAEAGGKKREAGAREKNLSGSTLAASAEPKRPRSSINEEWRLAVEAQKTVAKKGIIERQKPEEEEVRALKARLEQLAREKADLESRGKRKDRKQIEQIRAAMEETAKAYKEELWRLLEARSDFYVQREAEQIVRQINPELAERYRTEVTDFYKD